MKSLALALALLLFSAAALSSADASEKKKYIVYLGKKLHPSVDAVASHHDLLAKILGSNEEAKNSIFHSYQNSMNAFAAMLTSEEAEQLADLPDVISVIPCKTRTLQTTRSWDYMGLTQEVQRRKEKESDIIIGVIDSGIDPSLKSFSDEGFGPPPARWKGSCGPYVNFTCNNKIIGAKMYRLTRILPTGDVPSPLDMTGHGTHTAAIAAGAALPDSNFFGLAAGTARGGAPAARIAVYKVCFADGQCHDEDVLAAMDTAIVDGVDIISLSLATDVGLTMTDVISIGSFHALEYNVLTSAAAGNQGPFHRSIMNYAPWMLTVGASSMDREFRADLTLGNGDNYPGVTVNIFDSMNQSFPLVRGYDAVASPGMELEAMRCMPNALNPEMVTGKIVHCVVTGGAGTSDLSVKEAGGVGMIVQLYKMVDDAEIYLLPTAVVAKPDGMKISDYIKSSKSPVGSITRSYVFNASKPTVPRFSGRGPNPVYRNILKPDVVAPGVDIVSAHPGYLPVRGLEPDQRSLTAMLSGTSMAAPHVTAIAAYIKSFHPDWSPTAIKSAIMTSATVMTRESTNLTDMEYAYGSGLVNPVKAVDPGLVYDMQQADWLTFLCAQTDDITAIRLLTASEKLACADLPKIKPTYDHLNYPSFHFTVEESKQPGVAVYRRVVTNVGGGAAVYNAVIEAPSGVNVTVFPTKLTFRAARRKRSFKVIVRTPPQGHRPAMIVSGALTWSDGSHSVRSPIVVHYT